MDFQDGDSIGGKSNQHPILQVTNTLVFYVTRTYVPTARPNSYAQ